jgi:Spy/CpxP family protein refolding chaperone
MKKTIISIALAMSLVSLYAPQSSAHDNRQKDAQQHEFRMLKSLDLNQTQKQDIKQIMKQTKQNNGAYMAGKHAQQAQLRALLTQESWDAETAKDLIEQSLPQSTQMQLNRAIARNQSYQVLNDEQKAELIRKQNKGAAKERKNRDLPRMAKGLELSEEQRSTMKDIQQSLRAKNAPLKATMQDYKQAQQVLVLADSFDQEAWLALQVSMQPTLVTVQLNQLEARFQMRSILNQEQLDMLKQREGKADKRNAKRKGGLNTQM